MNNPAPGFKKRPDHRIETKPAGRRVQVKYQGELIADSRNALVMHEGTYAPVYYLPRLFLDKFWAVAGGVWWWGFEKQLAQISREGDRYSVRGFLGNEDIISLQTGAKDVHSGTTGGASVNEEDAGRLVPPLPPLPVLA